MLTEIRFALRKLRQSPGFTSIAVFTLAVGIGMDTAIFSLMHDLFLRGLAFAEPSRVVRIYGEAKERDLKQLPFSVPKFWHYRDGQNVFSSIAADWRNGFIMTGQGDPAQLLGANVTANYFDLLGIRPILGRNFLPQEELNADVTLVTESFWRKRFNSDAMVLGRSITLNGIATTIVGVLPDLPISWFGRNSEIFVTKPFEPSGITKDRLMRGVSFMRCTARLKPGVTIGQAQAAMAALERSYREQHPEAADNSWTSVLVPASEDVTGNLRPAFTTLLAAVGAVLLIACSNVANLLLVRFTGRRREIALRMALGASRASVLRLFIFESLLVSILAGLAGAALAWQLVPLVPKMAANFLPFDPETGVSLSFPVLGFTIALSILTGVAMGIYPALQSSRADLVDGLKEGGRGTSGSLHTHRIRKILVGAQVALSVTLLAGAALLITSFVQLNRQNIGFRPENLWIGLVTLPQAPYPDLATRQRFVEKTLGALQRIPSIQRATISADIPLIAAAASNALYTRPDGEILPLDKRASAASHNIAPDYFKTWGIPILAGREFDQHDVADHQNVMLISQAGARKVFGNENPIGKTLLVSSASTPVEIIGVVGDVRTRTIAKPDEVEIYRPWGKENFQFAVIAVRSTLREDAVTKVVQTALSTVDPGLAIAIPQSMNTIVAQALGQARLMMWLLGIFAGAALLLATVGIYGAVAYTVEQRVGEIGVRMALGAQTMDVLRLVVKQGMRPVIFGLVVGLVAALALGRLIASQLYQTSSHNPLLLGMTMSILGSAALLACIFPARRASQVDPIVALRYE